jgi:hypothetical protein
MKQTRPKLDLRLGEAGVSSEPPAEQIVCHAIEHQLCLRATYNRGLVILAPHILYTKHGDHFLDAVVIERDGMKPAEVKLGTFRLSGLRGVVPTTETFSSIEGYDPADARYGESVIARLDA